MTSFCHILLLSVVVDLDIEVLLVLIELAEESIEFLGDHFPDGVVRLALLARFVDYFKRLRQREPFSVNALLLHRQAFYLTAFTTRDAFRKRFPPFVGKPDSIWSLAHTCALPVAHTCTFAMDRPWTLPMASAWTYTMASVFLP